MSGMGQGMLFPFANLLVLSKCRLVNDVINTVILQLQGRQMMRTFKFTMSSMAASDDVTMIAMNSAKKMKEAFFGLKVLVLVNFFISRCWNKITPHISAICGSRSASKKKVFGTAYTLSARWCSCPLVPNAYRFSRSLRIRPLGAIYIIRSARRVH